MVHVDFRSVFDASRVSSRSSDLDEVPLSLDRPSSVILAQRLAPEALWKFVALYEHAVFTRRRK